MSTDTDGPIRIDLHGHFLPSTFGEILRQHGFPFIPPWSPQAHLSFMDRWGIQASVVSQSLYFDFGDAAETSAIARMLNDEARSLLDRHGDRFAVAVALPLPDVRAAIAELKYAVDTLELDNAVMIFANYRGVYLGDPAYDELYSELDRRGTVVWVHPAFPAQFPGSRVPSYLPASPLGGEVLEFPFETTRAAVNLMYKGVLRDYPNIRWQLSHAGGALPYLTFRLGLMHTIRVAGIDTSAIAGPYGHAREFFYDTGVAASAEQLEPTKHLAGVDQIVFGTDWPYTEELFRPDAAQQWPWFAELLPQEGDPQPALSGSFSHEERLRIERTTPLRLYPRLAARP